MGSLKLGGVTDLVADVYPGRAGVDIDGVPAENPTRVRPESCVRSIARDEGAGDGGEDRDTGHDYRARP